MNMSALDRINMIKNRFEKLAPSMGLDLETVQHGFSVCYTNKKTIEAWNLFYAGSEIEAELHTPQSQSDFIKYLRMHQIILLHLGDYKPEEILNVINDERMTQSIANNIWFLNNSPLSEQIIADLRKATDNAMCKSW